MNSETSPKAADVQAMFDRLAHRYNLFNRLSTMGLDSVWRARALEPVSSGMSVLDLGCGTGDLVLGAAKRLKGRGRITGLDFSSQMLKVAEERLKSLDPQSRENVHFVNRSAEDLPIEEMPYDLVLSGFVLRNLYGRIDAVLKGVSLSVRRGGRLSFLDFTEPSNAALRACWRFYMNSVVALYGKILFGKNYPDFYMTASAERFLKMDEFVRKLAENGFSDIRARRFLFGVIVHYEAVKN